MEDEAHLLLQELQQHVINQVSKGNKINQRLQEILVHLESHVNPTPAPVVDATPVVSEPVATVVDATPVVSEPVATVVEPTITVEAPQTVAQEQSAANKAN
jgi:hypothetical protein